MYGPTETTIWSMVQRVEAEDNTPAIGSAIANTQIYLVDPDQTNPQLITTVPVGEPGELLIGGVGVARGYLNRPELTAAKFIPDPFSSLPGARLYRTGDLARYRNDGNIEYIGRIDHQVKIRGFRIELGDIEAALHEHPGVREAVVIAREDIPGDKRLVAYVVVQGHLDLHQLRTFLQGKLPDYMVPSAFVVLDILPLTPNGKVNRQALPAPEQTRAGLEIAYVAPRTGMETELAQIWAQVLGLQPVGINDNFFELGGNSLLAAQLLTQVRETFELELPLQALFGAPTVAGLAEVITIAQDTNSTSMLGTIEVAELHRDAVLEPHICPEPPCLASIFLTGATGFIGAFLLQELLEQTPATIYCLVRADSLEAGKDKIRANMERYLLPSEQLERIVPVLGDLSEPLLGLSEGQFRELAATVDIIYHGGAFVNLIYPYTALRAANVQGTKEVLKLASQNKVKPVHFISTLDVFQSAYYKDMEVILEADDLTGGEGLSDGYAQSKWVAEKLVMAARSRGIPTCIYRLGMISGHSHTGASQSNDLVCRLIKGLIELGSAPQLDLKLSLTPVDFVSQAIVHLSQQPESTGKAFHIVSPEAVPWSQLVQEIRAIGYNLKLTDYDRWQNELLQVASSQADNALSPLLFLFTEWGSQNQQPYLETAALVSQAFDRQNTLTGLAGTNIVCPTVDTNLLRAYFSNLGLKQPSIVS